MNLLLDTHTLLWATLAPHRLGKQAAARIKDPANSIYVSAASAWEIATKVRLGKLRGAEVFEQEFLSDISKAGYNLLNITAAHALRAGRLIGDHRDPFDRIIAAQSIAEDFPVVSIDTRLETFGIRRIW